MCAAGDFCPQAGTLRAVRCPLGAYSGSDGAAFCDHCPAGSHCPDLGTSHVRTCPPGFLCDSEATGSYNQLEPCPAGFYCPSLDLPEGGLTQYLGPLLCPDGYWCPEGTATPWMISGNFSTPQRCADGLRCEPHTAASAMLLADPSATPDPSGAKDPWGVAECPVGSYCAEGRARVCPQGTFCAFPAAGKPRECAPGSFQPEAGKSECELCPAGTFCYYTRQSQPYTCTPGYTCYFEGGASPARPCPAGSYCPGAMAGNSSASPMQHEHRPRLCQATTYCLWGVFTDIVDPNNVQAAQQCSGGNFCVAGSATPEGKGKCREGFYCPPDTPEMKAAPPGTYSEGAGNSAPEDCRPGTFQRRW